MGTVYIVLYVLSIVNLIECGYPPTGDEVIPGSVLLPATRRGRYLANIVRRQAVDGTGIKFNKDADRMNAEAKKKVDVLSEELLPYIIAEQERRTTLHKRVMTAIQNGEKGVTIAEMRNKPPLIIRKGLMYRCPANRAPKEPDGSGVLLCEDDITPTQVMYDACLSAEDKELYNAENKYFFCNRHKIEGPDLPRNGTTVYGCAPIERTSFNYTTTKCSLEDTEDVVVHYRYYPDRTYKYVTELDPDREVCDHWNPCQIGYIFSLPSPDMATPASELWPDAPDTFEDYEKDEIVPPIPEDSIDEYVHPSMPSYTSSPRTISIPHSGRRNPSISVEKIQVKNGKGKSRKINQNDYSVKIGLSSITITLSFEEFTPKFFGTFYAICSVNNKLTPIRFLALIPSNIEVAAKTIDALHGQKLNSSLIPVNCDNCRVHGLMVRARDNNVYNIPSSRFRVKL
ncbi:uncharacterized protein LOC125239410 [Leguminivora glycinivorella]|uniref:uncharacterized protein LOC125239410 n=1 Tax=Leguminivora glycinivorella TaxID=1035111 RepID=UPI00200E31A1|nr:uncharacterized protein LOC125239410 [Leguminivora glycinivorella]